MYILMIAAAFQAAFSPMNAEQGGWCCDLGVQGMAHGQGRRRMEMREGARIPSSSKTRERGVVSLIATVLLRCCDV